MNTKVLLARPALYKWYWWLFNCPFDPVCWYS